MRARVMTRKRAASRSLKEIKAPDMRHLSGQMSYVISS